MTGVYVLLAVLVLCGVLAGFLRWKNGRFAPATDDGEYLTAADLGADLGERVTLVQFSSAFCTPCRATRAVLGQVSDLVPGVATVDIDAESALDLVRRFDILRTPTVLVLDASGKVVGRASGAPTRDQVLVAVDAAIAG